MNLMPVSDSSPARSINVTLWRANEYLRSESELASMMGVRGAENGSIGAIGFGREIELGKQLEDGGRHLRPGPGGPGRDIEGHSGIRLTWWRRSTRPGKFIDFLGVDFVFRLMGSRSSAAHSLRAGWTSRRAGSC
jgi:hypothetical protein